MKNRSELNNKAELLLREIGEIDDRLLCEALTYRPEAKSRFNFKPRAIAIAVAACLALLVGVRALPELLTKNKDEADDLPQLNDPAADAWDSLDALLSSTKNAGYQRLDSAAELSYTSGALIVWRFEGEESLYFCPISSTEYTRLEKLAAYGSEVGESSPELECDVWIVDGKGNVTSPYLKASAGNVGCSVFDYDAELMPTEQFVNYIAEVIS